MNAWTRSQGGTFWHRLLATLALACSLAAAQTQVIQMQATQTQATPSQATTVPLSPTQEARAQAVGRTIRCPVCQGLPITESPVELSQQMLRELREQVRAGRTSEQITAFFAARYGDTVLLDPPRRGVNLLLWLGPFAAALIGGWQLLAYLKRARSAAPVQDASDDDTERDGYLAQVRLEAGRKR